MGYDDPNDEGNTDKYHTGKLCIEEGCDRPAGTGWSPYWCFKHNVDRMRCIDKSFAEMEGRFGSINFPRPDSTLDDEGEDKLMGGGESE